MPSLIDLTGYFISLCFAIFCLFWLVTAFSTKRTVQRSGGWRFTLIGVALAGFLISRFVSSVFPGVRQLLWPQSLFTCLIGDALSLAGLSLLLWARVILGRNWSAGVVLKAEHELITRGPYRFVRHPIYTGALLMMLGYAVWSAHASAFLVLATVFVLLRVKAGAEEQLLTRHFGDGYRAYKARVKALIPYVL